MEEAVGDLILTPFRDIVTQANVAISNAKDGGDEQMLKAAQSLIKEGERALKRIEPLCRKHFDESGSHFVNAVKDNEEIAQLSEVLTNVLYDFEDYVEADGFDAEKFAELQALSRKAAPRIVHIITRMKLEASRPELDTRADPLISATSLQQEPQNIGQTSALQTNIATPVETTNQEAPVIQMQQIHGHPNQASLSQGQPDPPHLQTPEAPWQALAMDRFTARSWIVERGTHTKTVPTGGLVSASFAAGPSTDPNSSQPPNSLQGLASSHQAGLEAVHPIQEIPDGLILVEDGLIPVESDTTSSRGGSDGTARKVDCSITLSSSFYQFKGFCEGAKEVIRGGPGVKKIKKQGLSIGAVEVAKCKCCPYELDWRQVERDVNGEDSGNYRSSGIGFRLRFLSKSHIPAKHIEDQIYGCLFCIQLGRTVEESDATVFFSQKQLFAHIARHPRPLPAIPGLTVIEGPEMPVRSRNNYDLWFTNPPVASQMTHIAREISVHPTATAAETYRQTPIRGIRRPPDGHRVLQFAVGAKIVGIEFPPRYNGEWCTGWADNEWAVFPAETVRLEPPPKSQIRMQGASNMKAVARWKWSYKGKDQGHWLKFDKGDTITGIGWTYSEHWCWSGTNSKGQWGIFPQSHIEPNTLSETPVKSDRASISSSEKRRSSLFPRISIRGRSDSASGSSSSHDAAVASSPRPSIF
ncbi:Sh3 domain-containing protein [Pleurostoma richardsiae]|uniref:Sh3 domain-containing protein n=1 Tax=Pleurostoma richardsiae TaxID=41990 RepID=A0AA38VRY5_9PEZI|nr:Sh3 domain-containing protein [Pleurostoma richardsiae]